MTHFRVSSELKSLVKVLLVDSLNECIQFIQRLCIVLTIFYTIYKCHLLLRVGPCNFVGYPTLQRCNMVKNCLYFGIQILEHLIYKAYSFIISHNLRHFILYTLIKSAFHKPMLLMTHLSAHHMQSVQGM